MDKNELKSILYDYLKGLEYTDKDIEETISKFSDTLEYQEKCKRYRASKQFIEELERLKKSIPFSESAIRIKASIYIGYDKWLACIEEQIRKYTIASNKTFTLYMPNYDYERLQRWLTIYVNRKAITEWKQIKLNDGTILNIEDYAFLDPGDYRLKITDLADSRN